MVEPPPAFITLNHCTSQRPWRSIRQMTALYDLKVQQGADFDQTLSSRSGNDPYPDFSSGYTAKMQVRAGYADTGAPVLLELDDEDGIQLGDGYVRIMISAARSDQLGEDAAIGTKLLYDVVVIETSTGQVTRAAEGELILNRGVTQ